MKLIKRILKNLIGVITSRIKSIRTTSKVKEHSEDKQMIVCFFPKESNCAVEKTYLLLMKNGLKEEHKYQTLYSNDWKLFDFSKINLQEFTNVVILGHYFPPNFKVPKNSLFIQSSLIRNFIHQKLLYGHICYGSLLYKDIVQIKDWVSYDNGFFLLFGIPDTDLRIVNFFYSMFDSVQKSNEHNQMIDSIKNTYIKEMKYLKQNKDGSVGYNVLLSLLFEKYKCLQHN